MSTTQNEVHIAAPPVQVYRALLDPEVIVQYRVPDGMHAEIHLFEPWEGGAFRISLIHDAAGEPGKTTANTDTYCGEFASLAPNERVVERLRFETDDDSMQGEMRIVTELMAESGGTRVSVRHEGLPPGVTQADNDAGWQAALGRLAALLAPAP